MKTFKKIPPIYNAKRNIRFGWISLCLLRGCFLFMKLIPLTQGKFAQVDDEDFEYLSKFKWHALKSRNTFYAGTGVGSKKMHHLLIGKPPSGMVTDHKDGDGLNNQKINLRNCTIGENNKNRKCLTGASKYLGVSQRKTYRNTFEVNIRVNNKNLYLGSFKNELYAALKYNEAAIKYHGEFAKLNIIDENSDINEPINLKYSIYRGVTYNKNRGKYTAGISVNKVKYNLGYFIIDKDAALAYNKKAIELLGEKAILNIINE